LQSAGTLVCWGHFVLQQQQADAGVNQNHHDFEIEQTEINDHFFRMLRIKFEAAEDGNLAAGNGVTVEGWEQQ
jgi:hypothetical protein